MVIGAIKIAKRFHKVTVVIRQTCCSKTWSRRINEKFHKKSKVTIVIETAHCGRMRHYKTEYIHIEITQKIRHKRRGFYKFTPCKLSSDSSHQMLDFRFTRLPLNTLTPNNFIRESTNYSNT